MLKRYKFQHSHGEGVALYGRDQAQGGEVGEVGEGVARGSPGAVLLPSCPTPAMHQYRAACPTVKQGEGQKLVFPFRYRKRLSRYNT